MGSGKVVFGSLWGDRHLGTIPPGSFLGGGDVACSGLSLHGGGGWGIPLQAPLLSQAASFLHMICPASFFFDFLCRDCLGLVLSGYCDQKPKLHRKPKFCTPATL